MSGKVLLALVVGLVLALAGLALLVWLLWWLWTRGEREKEAQVVEIELEPMPMAEETVEEQPVAALLASDEPGDEPPATVEVTEPETLEPAARLEEIAVAGSVDNLELIEGIGPRIAGVLREAGITTFAQLAVTGRDSLAEILRAADPRLLRLADPASWPDQARLAGAGEWDGLAQMQRELRGGRRRA